MILVVMGVTGCGKTTIGKLLAGQLSLPFFDADAFHSKENIDKMSTGISLTDEDRYPWLHTLSNLLLENKLQGAVLACSALKEEYRKILQQGVQDIVWIFLEGTETVIRERMQKRDDHFMPDSLLRSQFLTLEKPVYAHCVSIEDDPHTIVNDILNLLKKSDQ